MVSWVLIGVSYQSSICLHGVKGNHYECLVNRLFVSMVSRECIVSRLFASMVSRLLIGSVLSIVYLPPWCQGNSLWVSCQSSIYLNGVMGTQCVCLVNRLFISMVSWILIRSVLSIFYLSPCCQGNSLWVSCQSSFYLHGVMGTLWECLVNRLLISLVSRELNVSVLSIVYSSPLFQGSVLSVV